MAERSLAPGEWAVLALLSERPSHGWAVASQLGPSGELGSVWSLGRPLVYRSIDILAERGLIKPAGHEPGLRGPNRTIYRTTCAGGNRARAVARGAGRARPRRALPAPPEAHLRGAHRDRPEADARGPA